MVFRRGKFTICEWEIQFISNSIELNSNAFRHFTMKYDEYERLQRCKKLISDITLNNIQNTRNCI